jgi:primase-polymerase (primpol)-like protein
MSNALRTCIRVPVTPAAIPAELRALEQWVCWREEWRADAQGELKATKVPINPLTGGRAAVDKPMTWTSFEEALAVSREHDGIGFVFTESDPYCGVDLDGCRDPDSGEIATWGWEIMQTFNTYTEVSPSGTGVKLFCRGVLPHGAWHKKALPFASYVRKSAAIETYDRLHYFTMTGQVLEDLS